MATPLAHSLAGYAVSCFAPEGHGGARWKTIALCVVMANLADLDFIPGLFRNQPALYHQGMTHSIAFALLVCLGMAALLSLKGDPFPTTFALCFGAYATHMALDLIGPDKRPPYGIPLLWPASSRCFLSPQPLLLGMRHVSKTSAPASEWIRGILDRRNLLAMALEIALLAPWVFLAHWQRRRRIGSARVLT